MARKAVKIETVDPAKLEAIRRQWKERTPLLNRNQLRSEKAPDNARYMSDRNIRVDKEQRARFSDVLPTTGTAATGSQQKDQAKPASAPAPKLKNLALPLPLDPNPDGWRRKPRQETASSDTPPSPPSGGGVDQSIVDDKLPVGAINLLNAQESVYYSFYARMYEQIGPVWRSGVQEALPRSRPVGGDYVTQVDVVFDALGKLKEVRILRTSGIPEFDRVVIDSWKRIGKVPNPPKELIDNVGEVHTGWSFTVQVDASYRRGLPPQREY